MVTCAIIIQIIVKFKGKIIDHFLFMYNILHQRGKNQKKLETNLVKISHTFFSSRCL